MKRSRQRAVAVSGAVAAGVLSAGLGLFTAAPAGAAPGGHNLPGHDRNISGPGGPPPVGTRQSRPVATVSAFASPKLWPTAATADGVDAAAGSPRRTRYTAPFVTPADRVPTGVVSAAPTAAPVDAPADAAPVLAPESVPQPVAAAVVAPPAERPAVQPAVVPNRSAQLSVPLVEPSRSWVGIPLALGEANLPALLPELSPLALPGLFALLGLTALGAFLGYRQARAGMLLQTAGAARFHQMTRYRGGR